MKSFHLYTLTAVFLAALAGRADARHPMTYDEMDENEDGIVTRDEWYGADDTFIAQDSNGDGVLSGEELRVDRNNDGFVSRSEWWDDPEVFEHLDRDGNGMLSGSELENY